jgi:hypothetical protein
MEFRAEIRQITVVRDLLVEPVNLRKLYRLVIGDFGLRCLNLKSRIPGAALRPVKTAALRMRVAKRCIHDPKIRHAKHEFMDTDSGQQIVLVKQPIVGRVIEIGDVFEMCVVFGNPRKDAVAALTVCALVTTE